MGSLGKGGLDRLTLNALPVGFNLLHKLNLKAQEEIAHSCFFFSLVFFSVTIDCMHLNFFRIHLKVTMLNMY